MPPPPPFGHAERRYDGGYHEDGWRREGGRPGPHRRPSSYSPRRSDKHDSTPRRVRSKSPNHHRVAATVVGALAGGLVGNAAKKGHDGLLPTVAGAVVGGLGARELEKLYDRHEDKKAEAEARRERRRREREREREREWEGEYEWR
ncbi:hypothetical protein BS50DRAFT_575436 [Corynespora cassiicola Philippines]|uniref:Glycine zipper 2TM domain-containing protein n=1 Tax=Corynespora cassiicola Philippines TaxID=1448308 RepID=A0A2T2NJ07_CORCC|nr:hypothetical protein BS50DRAFT_575436 [Corynespora cassiicola Philippines]